MPTSSSLIPDEACPVPGFNLRAADASAPVRRPGRARRAAVA
jgi:hypothetical protein